jgi:HK97 family phage major capsid protein
MSKKQELFNRMDLIVKSAAAEGRGLTEAEKVDFDKYEAEFRLTGYGEPRGGRGHVETRGAGSGGRTAEDEAFTRYLRTGDTSGLQTRSDGTGLSSAPNSAGLSAGSTGDYAGYMIPQGFWENLQVALKAYGGCANDMRLVETDTGAPMPWPTIDPTAITGSWLGASSELTQLSVEDSYNFGEGMLNAWTVYAGPILASLQLVQDSAFDVDDFVAARLGEAVGRTIASAAVSGSGSGQPEGVITAINAKGSGGSGAGGYITLGTATSVDTFAGSTTELSGNVLSPATLLKLVANVDPAYYPQSKFWMNSTQAWNMRGVVDSNGRPILSFLNGLNADDVLNNDYTKGSAVGQMLGFPVMIDNSVTSLDASTTTGPIFGSLQHSMVYRQVRNAGLMRLNERYADYLAIGYLLFMRADIRSNDMRAITCVKASTS